MVLFNKPHGSLRSGLARAFRPQVGGDKSCGRQSESKLEGSFPHHVMLWRRENPCCCEGLGHVLDRCGNVTCPSILFYWYVFCLLSTSSDEVNQRNQLNDYSYSYLSDGFHLMTTLVHAKFPSQDKQDTEKKILSYSLKRNGKIRWRRMEHRRP